MESGGNNSNRHKQRRTLSYSSRRVGALTSLTTVDQSTGESAQQWPEFLPDGNHFLYLVQPGSNLWVRSIDGADRKHLLSDVSRAAYSDGYLMYERQDTLFAQSFSPERLEIEGEVGPVANDLRITVTDYGPFSISSRGGVLAYAPRAESLMRLT